MLKVAMELKMFKAWSLTQKILYQKHILKISASSYYS